MPEILLHYIWQQQIFRGYAQQTTDGRQLEILSVGEHNLDAGPDFTNVHLRIDGQEWFGNIEIHVHASDWYKHHHQEDSAYDSIILHVVRDADREIVNSKGETIPQCELRYPVDEDYLSRLVSDARMMDSGMARHKCASQLLSEPALLTEGWKKTLLRHRLRCKKESIDRLLTITKQDWEQAFYISLAHYFGFHTNGVPFELMAINTPLRILQKHRNSLFQLNAILLGQAGLFESRPTPEPEESTLEEGQMMLEYRFLKQKFGLTSIEPHLWKRARMRPQNFPETRIRQFAQLLYQQEHLLAQVLDAKSIDELRAIFAVPTLGAASVDTLLINAAIPFRYALRGEEDAIRLLESIPAEKNSVIRQWQLLGQRVKTAADTQALIHLYVNYCSGSRCVNCDVAYQIFLQNA